MRISPATFWGWLDKVEHLLPPDMTIAEARKIFEDNMGKAAKFIEITRKVHEKYGHIFKDNDDDIENRLENIINDKFEEGV